MKLLLAGLLMGLTAWAGPGTAPEAVQRGLRWLVSTQGRDGGWGQDGGETSFVRTGERLEHAGNDVANTAVAVLALLHAGHSPERGQYAAHSRRGLEFILKSIEQSPAAGLAVTGARDTQIQRKLGPYIDTFLSSMLLSELDTRVQDPNLAARVRASLKKCVAKIEQNQQRDGSWNASGGWAPVIGTSMASRSLYKAKDRGVVVDEKVMARVDKYTRDTLAAPSASASPVALYQGAQALEQMSRSEGERKKNAAEIRQMTAQLSDAQYVRGFGSMGGEEFFSYLNISESMKRAGGKPWHDWNEKMKTQLVQLQNQDGTWAGHHCITGRVSVTGAAILTLLVDRQLERDAVIFFSAAAFRNETEGRWLLDQQSADGGWHSRTYGLLRSGQSLTGFVMASLGNRDPRGLAFLAAHTNEEGAVGLADPLLPDYPNYATALAVQVTGVSKSVEYLLSRQFTEADGWREADAAYGAWGMGGDRRAAPNAGHVDISMTRHALAALSLAPAHPAMHRARIFLSRLQNDDGGFRFSTVVLDANKAGEASYGTATADGAISLIAAGDRARIDAAKSWLLKHHRPDAAPGLAGKWPQGMRYYYAAASAQAFRLLGLPRDRDQDRLLRAERRRNGSWANPEPLVKEDDPLIATGFALSALR